MVETARWFVTAVERTTQGRVRSRPRPPTAWRWPRARTPPAVYANLGEVLMAAGQLRAAEACYRDAVAAASVPSRSELRRTCASLASIETPRGAGLDDPRGRAQDLTLAYLGLAVALDRDGQPRAARETMLRALALDSTTSVLKVAELPSADLFFVPTGTSTITSGCAVGRRPARRRRADAFREFLARAPGAAGRARAEAHLSELGRRPAPSRIAPSVRRPRRPAGGGPRVIAVGTVLATGGSLAPLIDAAWREQAAILDDCLSAAPRAGRRARPRRLASRSTIDGRGRVSSAAVKLPPAAAGLRRTLCALRGTAVETRLRLPAPPAGATDAGAHRAGRSAFALKVRSAMSSGRRSRLRSTRQAGIGEGRCAAPGRDTSPSKGRSAPASAASPRSWARRCRRGSSARAPQENPFLGPFYKDRRRHAMSAQLFFLLQRYAQQGELAQGDLFSRGGVVSDYLFAKDRLFATLNLSDDELALYDRIYQMLKPRTVTPDLVVYLQARTDVLLDRIRKRGRPRRSPIRAEYVEEVARRTPTSSSTTTRGRCWSSTPRTSTSSATSTTGAS